MLPEIFILSLGVVLAVLFSWGFKVLPKEKWQVIGCVLGEKGSDGSWKGLNMTYYGLFNATAYFLAAGVFFILCGSISVPASAILILLAAVLVICMPASGLIALWVEGKANTFTVGGASFIGLLAAPWTFQYLQDVFGKQMGFDASVMGLLAALSIAFAFGEGTGRLACISFGCCYGKPLSACPPLVRRIFSGWVFVFTGQTKKIAYAHHLDGRKVFPIQAVTAVLLAATGLAGCYAFLEGFHRAAFCGTLVVTQVWRVLSEFLRADFRGGGRMSAYQVMSLLSIPYAFLIMILFPHTGDAKPDLATGFLALWDPAVLLCLEVLWIVAFLYTGRSRVTGSTIRLHVVKERI